MTTSLQTKKDNTVVQSRNYRAAYTRIEADIRGKIRDRVWPPGAMVPGRRQLAKEYKVSLGTIERAIANLLADGSVQATDRRATIVSQAAAPVDNAKRTGLTATGTIGIVCSSERRDNQFHWTHSWEHAIVTALERTIASSGFRSRFAEVKPVRLAPQSLEKVVAELCDSDVAGIVFVLFDDRAEEIQRIVNEKSKVHIPVLTINSEEILCLGSCVYYDNRDAGYRAALHLIDCGCKSFQFISPYTATFGERRLSGIRSAIASNNLPASSLIESVCPSPIGAEFMDEDVEKGLRWVMHDVAGAVWAEHILAAGITAEGIIAVNDQVANAYVEVALNHGLTVGKDFAIIGFDDLPEARVQGLTTMRPPLHAMGVEAGRLIVQAASAQPIGHNVCLHSELITRQSSHLDRTKSNFMSVQRKGASQK